MIADSSYSINDYLAAIRRRRKLFVLAAGPIVAIAAAVALSLPSEYRSYARMDIDLEGANARTLEPIALTRYADQYIAKLRDRVLLNDNLLPLARDPEVFGPEFADVGESDRLSLIRGSVSVTRVTQPVLSPGTNREVDVITGFQVTSTDNDPEFAYHIAKFVAAKFLDEDREIRTERANSTTMFLSEQTQKVEREILQLEQEIADFKVEHACCLPELMQLNMAVIQRAEREIEDLQPRIRALEQDRIFLQSQLSDIQVQSSTADRLTQLEEEYLSLVANYGTDHPDVLKVRREITAITSVGSGGNDTVELVALRIELAEAQQRYSDAHPDVRRLKREIAALEAETRRSGGNTGQSKLRSDPRYIQLRGEINAIDTQLVELRTKGPELRQKIADYEERLIRTPQIESDYRAIIRKFDTARGNAEDLQERLVIARQSEALESTDIGARLRQGRDATPPNSPSGPPRIGIVIIGIFVAGVVGSGLMLIAEMSDTSVRGSRDIAMVADMVPLATIPVVQNRASVSARHRVWYLVGGAALLIVSVAILVVMSGAN